MSLITSPPPYRNPVPYPLIDVCYTFLPPRMNKLNFKNSCFSSNCVYGLVTVIHLLIISSQYDNDYFMTKLTIFVGNYFKKVNQT